MADDEVLSVIDTTIEFMEIGIQGPPGADGSSSTISKINGESFTIRAGQPIYFSGSGQIKLAKADSMSHLCQGFATSDISTSASGLVQLSGILNLTDWSIPLGLAGNLIEGTEYFLSQGAFGIVTSIPPDGSGQICQYLGFAMDSLNFFIEIAQPIVA